MAGAERLDIGDSEASGEMSGTPDRLEMPTTTVGLPETKLPSAVDVGSGTLISAVVSSMPIVATPEDWAPVPTDEKAKAVGPELEGATTESSRPVTMLRICDEDEGSPEDGRLLLRPWPPTAEELVGTGRAVAAGAEDANW